jgi:hypothetical protein
MTVRDKLPKVLNGNSSLFVANWKICTHRRVERPNACFHYDDEYKYPGTEPENDSQSLMKERSSSEVDGVL